MKTMAADYLPQIRKKPQYFIVERGNSGIYTTLSHLGECYSHFCKKEIMNLNMGCLVLWLRSSRPIELVVKSENLAELSVFVAR